MKQLTLSPAAPTCLTPKDLRRSRFWPYLQVRIALRLALPCAFWLDWICSAKLVLRTRFAKLEAHDHCRLQILEIHDDLSFHLQQQRLIELIRAHKMEEALEFAQEYLAPRGEEDPQFLEELGVLPTLFKYPQGRLASDCNREVKIFLWYLTKDLNAALASCFGSERILAGPNT